MDAETDAPATPATVPPPHARRRVAVVLNGAAGALLDREDGAESLRTLFAEAGLEPDIVPPEAGTLPERMKRALAMGHGAVVVGGGDGTIACAAQVLAGGDAVLGILPFGTMNLLATDLGIAAGEPEAALAVVAAGHVRAIDVGEVGGRVFLCASMLGVPASLGRVRERGRGGARARLWTRFALAAARAFLRRRSLRAEMEQDGAVRRVRSPAVTISVNKVDDATGRRLGRAKLDGGTFGIYVVRRLGAADLLRLALRFARGRWYEDRAVDESEARTVIVRSRRRALHAMNDGELALLPTPLEYRLRPRALRVFAPAPEGGA
jgi:diacylglycerol kinase family enzyme